MKTIKNRTALPTFFLAFVLSLAFSVGIVSACINPVLRTDEGKTINFFGTFTVNESDYPEDALQITYNMQVRNANSEPLTITLEPEDKIIDYVSSPIVEIPPNSVGTLPLKVWIGGNDIWGKLDAIYSCGGSPYGISVSAYINIIGKGNQTPPMTTCHSPSKYNGCYGGYYTTFTCSDGALVNRTSCSKYCCQKEGGHGSFCVDRTTCLAMSKLPTPTEGKIALVCKDDECGSGIEKNIWILFRWKGWDVFGKSYKNWNEDELSQYDIIACSDSTACKANFNSTLYNAYFEKRKPFLEIPSSSGAKAAYSFGYVSTSSGKTVKDPSMTYASDYITSGISSPGIFTYGNSFSGVEGGKINNGVKSVANSSDNKNSLIFKVKETVDHGRYAYIGLFTKSELSELTLDGGKIFNNTLKWLRYGDAWFGGTNNDQPRKGKIAYICSSSKCSSKSDIDLIKYLRTIGYSVDLKSQKDWLSSNLNQYNVIVCASSSSCKIPVGSNIYNAHKFSGKDFVEITSTSKLYAAYAFGYVASSSAKGKSSTNISFVNNDPIISGLPKTFVINARSKSMVGLLTPLPASMTDIAHISYKGADQNISTMFYIPESSGHGRYIFVGWLGKFDAKIFNGNGKLLLERAINWANCGSITCEI